jgi:signal transduction histidine kinase
MHATRSLRFHLALTYAGIALLTAAILGGVLLSVLGNYYARAEDAYLKASATRIAGDAPPVGDAAQLTNWVQLAALATQTRVRVFDTSGKLVADSGSPRELDPGAIVTREGDGPRRGDRDQLPAPLGGGIFGGTANTGRPSNRALRVTYGDEGGYVQLSEAPASGTDALIGVAQAWALAAILAVILSALAGYLVSSRISRPVVALTDASDRMADGDLSARAPVVRDDEVGQLAESFNAMAGRIEVTVTALRRFVADAAHEIGTPLTALQADLELAERAAVTDDERRLVDRALGQARRLEDLSGNLLQLSRIEAGESSGDITLVDVASAAREAAELVASRAEQAGIQLELDIAHGPLVVAAERSGLQAVLGNLLDNAIKFTPEGGRVAVALRAEGGCAVLRVADTGVGIPAAEHAGVFSRFHRARNASAYPGSGLGLAIVRATVERVGGSVAFMSSEAGTEFRVSLPLAQPPA